MPAAGVALPRGRVGVRRRGVSLVALWRTGVRVPLPGRERTNEPTRPGHEAHDEAEQQQGGDDALRRLHRACATFPNLSSNDKPMQENRGSSPRIFAQSPDLDKIDS